MAAIEDRAVEKTDVVVLAFERLDFFFNERVQLGQIRGHIGRNIKIHGFTPRLTDVRGVPNCGGEWKRNRYRSVCVASLREEFAQVVRELDGFLLGDEMAAIGDRAAGRLNGDAAQRFYDQVAAPTRAAAAESQRRHRQFESGGEGGAVVRDVAWKRAIEIE